MSWRERKEPPKPWVYPPFDINRNAISGPIGQAQGIMCEIPVRSHVGNTFEGTFSVKERYP